MFVNNKHMTLIFNSVLSNTPRYHLGGSFSLKLTRNSDKGKSLLANNKNS